MRRLFEIIALLFVTFGLACLVAWHTVWEMFFLMHLVFFLAGVVCYFSFGYVWKRLRFADDVRKKICVAGVYYLLWCGFFFFVEMVIG